MTSSALVENEISSSSFRAQLAPSSSLESSKNKMGRNDLRRRSSLADDAAALAAMGHKQELQRNFSMLSMLGLAFAILNSWTALSASLSLALPSGGPTAVIWGLVTAGICNLCLAASLAEFLSAYAVFPHSSFRREAG